MDRVQTTIRLDPKLKRDLQQLAKLRGMTLNRLVTQVLQRLVVEDALVLQEKLRRSLEDLEKIADEDPGFVKAIAATAAAEAALIEDPVEGGPHIVEDHASRGAAAPKR